jgi:DNA-binding HxlR family transcriptional regulator
MQESCTVYQTVRYLTKKWTLLIILELYKGDKYTKRFSDLRESLAGITPKILSERLKELEEEGLISRRVDATSFPVRSEYTLTKSGLEIIEIIRDIKKWALKWKIENIVCGHQDCKVCIL